MNVFFTICPNVPGNFTLKVLLFTHFSRYPSETLHIHCFHLVDTIRITTRVTAITMAFLLHFKGGRKRLLGFFFVFSSTRSIVLYSPTSLSHLLKRQSVSFQMVPIICVSLLQGLSYRQLDLGMSYTDPD